MPVLCKSRGSNSMSENAPWFQVCESFIRFCLGCHFSLAALMPARFCPENRDPQLRTGAKFTHNGHFSRIALDAPIGKADSRRVRFAICNEIFKDWKLEDIFSYTHKLGYDGVE